MNSGIPGNQAEPFGNGRKGSIQFCKSFSQMTGLSRSRAGTVRQCLELVAAIEEVPGAPELRDGWRGLLDLGERWSLSDVDLWDDEWGQLPTGQPLTYGCELSRQSPDSARVTLRLWARGCPARRGFSAAVPV